MPQYTPISFRGWYNQLLLQGGYASMIWLRIAYRTISLTE